MADIIKTFTSDAALSYVDVRLRNRHTASGDEYFAHVVTRWDASIGIRKTIELSRLTPAQRQAGLTFYNAVHALAIADTTGNDFGALTASVARQRKKER